MMSENQTDQEPRSELASVVSVIEPAQPPVAANPTKTLDDYAKSILEFHKTIEDADQLSKKHGREAIAAAINAGQQLIAAKELVGHGNWLKWLEDNCEGITARTAQNYMKLANTKHVSYLGLATSLRQAYIVAGVVKATPEDKNPPPELEPEEEDQDDEGTDEAGEKVVSPTVAVNGDKEILRKLGTKIDTFTELAANLSQGLTDHQYDTCDVDDVPLHFALEQLKASLNQLQSLLPSPKDALTVAVEECSITRAERKEETSGVTPACF